MIPRYSPTYRWSDLFASLKFSSNDSTDQLAEALACLYGVRHVFLFDRARVALFALLRAYGRPGGVVVPAYNCIAIPECVVAAGYRVEFADIGENSFNMTSDTLEGCLSPNTTVVLLTHQFGIPCDVHEMIKLCRSRGVLVVEDAAAALGAKLHGHLVGTFSDATILSFHRTKVISGGLGGALLTNDGDLASAVSELMEQASSPRTRWEAFAVEAAWKIAMGERTYRAVHLGYRLLREEQMFEVVKSTSEASGKFTRPCSQFSKALVLGQLDNLKSNIQHRCQLAALYTTKLEGQPYLKLPTVPIDSSPSWIQFPLVVDNRKEFFSYMGRRGIDLNWTFRYCCPDSFQLDGFPNARKAARHVVGLPTYPSLPESRASQVCFAAGSYRPNGCISRPSSSTVQSSS